MLFDSRLHVNMRPSLEVMVPRTCALIVDVILGRLAREDAVDFVVELRRSFVEVRLRTRTPFASIISTKESGSERKEGRSGNGGNKIATDHCEEGENCSTSERPFFQKDAWASSSGIDSTLSSSAPPLNTSNLLNDSISLSSKVLAEVCVLLREYLEMLGRKWIEYVFRVGREVSARTAQIEREFDAHGHSAEWLRAEIDSFVADVESRICRPKVERPPELVRACGALRTALGAEYGTRSTHALLERRDEFEDALKHVDAKVGLIFLSSLRRVFPALRRREAEEEEGERRESEGRR